MFRNDYRAGDHNVICDRCGFKFHASQTSKTWDGLIVCYADFETRHPQDFVRGRKDNQNVTDGRPDSDGAFIGPTEAIQTESEINLQTEDGLYLMVESS